MSERNPSLTAVQQRSIRRALLRWYDHARRDLPWRRDHHPYHVWVSEIMLQQTRVAAVLDHYARFMLRFPTVQSLAAAREASVLAAWSGLGYYHRARRMRQAAKAIVRERHGEFPRTAQDWLQLPGIGRYTSAAIASIAFGEPVAVVDGNVERVLHRIAGTKQSGEATWREAESLLDRKCPGDFNQAMMELGATICTPRAPKCLVCPLRSFCQSRGAGQLLVNAARKKKELHYALGNNNGSVLLARRPADSALMAGMWELPTLTAEDVNGARPLLRLRHSITDTDYRVAVYAVAPDQLQDSATETKWFTASQCQRLPLTGLARKILHRCVLASARSLAVSK